MDRFKGLPLGRQLLLAGGLLLFIDTFFAWQKVSFHLGGISESVTASAWHGFWGVLLGLLTIALLAWVGARSFGVELPVELPDGLVTLALGALILLCALLKTLTESYSAWASYLGIVLAAVVAAGAWLTFQESGEKLPSMQAAGGRDRSTGAADRDATGTTDEVPEAPAGTDPA
jgi:hypothetical protein